MRLAARRVVTRRGRAAGGRGLADAARAASAWPAPPRRRRSSLDATRTSHARRVRSPRESISPARRAPSGGRRHADGLAHSPSAHWIDLVGGRRASASTRRGLVWLTAAGRRAPDESRNLREAVLSPDGTRVAGVSLEGGRSDIWVADVRPRRRNAADARRHQRVAGLVGRRPDGLLRARARTACTRSGGARRTARRRRRGAPGRRRRARVPARRLTGRVDTWRSPDRDRTQHADIWLLPLAGGAARPLVKSPFDDRRGELSHRIRRCCRSVGRERPWEIYVVRLGDGRRIVVSTERRRAAAWTRAGLYFQSRGSTDARARLARRNVARARALTREALVQAGTLRGCRADGRLLTAARRRRRPAYGRREPGLAPRGADAPRAAVDALPR